MKDMEIYKMMNKMAFPVLANALVEMIFSVADQAIIGRISVEGFAAVGVVANLLYLLTGTLGALSVAFTILFGKAIGNHDANKQSTIFSTAFSLACIIGVGFSAVSVLGGKVFLSKIYGLKADVLQYAYEYLVIACWGLGLNLLIFLFSAYFKNLKKTTITLVANIVSLTVNFIIDYVLVFGKLGFPKMGVKGAAIGTVVGLALNVIIFLFFFRRYKTVDFQFQIKVQEIKELITLYIPILGQDFVECTLFVMIITSIVTRLDTYSIAAYHLLEVMITFIILPAHAYGGVAMTLVSQNCEQDSLHNINQYPKIAIICSGILVSVIGGLILAFPNVLSIITDDTKLVREATNVCVFAIIIQLINVVSQVYKYTLQSMTYENWVFKYSTVISLLSCAVIFVIVCLMDMGLVGLYLGTGVMYFVLSVGYVKKFKMHKCCKKMSYHN